MVSVYSAETNETGSHWSRLPESETETAGQSGQRPAASSLPFGPRAPASNVPISRLECSYYINNQGLEDLSKDPVEARTQLRALKEQNYYKNGGTVPLSTNVQEKDQQLLDWDSSLYYQTGGTQLLGPDLDTFYSQIEEQRRKAAREIREAYDRNDRRGNAGRRRR